PAPAPPPRVKDLPEILGIAETGLRAVPDSPDPSPAPLDLRIKIAGFGGQGVLMLGQVLAEAGLHAGLEVSWLPSYGPEMRSGTSNCHVRLSHKPIDTPLVSRPDILLALNEPSLCKFVDSVETGGWILYNGSELPAGVHRSDVHFIAKPFAEIADQVGDARAGN